jgi:hypothetical protein
MLAAASRFSLGNGDIEAYGEREGKSRHMWY